MTVKEKRSFCKSHGAVPVAHEGLNPLPSPLRRAGAHESGATVFGYWVRDPERYGVVEFDSEQRAIGIEEKPQEPRSNYAVTGLYFYDNRVLDVAAQLKPSARGELEITDVNAWYLDRNELRVELLGRGYAWLDTGTHRSLLQASNFIETVEERQGLKIACVEEVAYRVGLIDADQLARLAAPLEKSGYGESLMQVVAERSAPNK